AGFVAEEVDGQDLAVRRDDPDGLRPVSLFDDRPEEVVRLVRWDAVGVEGDGDERFADAADDRRVVQGTRTESGGVASAAFQRNAVTVAPAGGPEEKRPPFGLSLAQRLGGVG